MLPGFVRCLLCDIPVSFKEPRKFQEHMEKWHRAILSTNLDTILAVSLMDPEERVAINKIMMDRVGRNSPEADDEIIIESKIGRRTEDDPAPARTDEIIFDVTDSRNNDSIIEDVLDSQEEVLFESETEARTRVSHICDVCHRKFSWRNSLIKHKSNFHSASSCQEIAFQPGQKKRKVVSIKSNRL